MSLPSVVEKMVQEMEEKYAKADLIARFGTSRPLLSFSQFPVRQPSDGRFPSFLEKRYLAALDDHGGRNNERLPHQLHTPLSDRREKWRV